MYQYDVAEVVLLQDHRKKECIRSSMVRFSLMFEPNSFASFRRSFFPDTGSEEGTHDSISMRFRSFPIVTDEKIIYE